MSSSTIKLQSNDNVVIEVERQVAERSMLLKHIIIDVPDALTEAIPLDKVNPPRGSQHSRLTNSGR
jgi:S-phase kinase-associated protein 1